MVPEERAYTEQGGYPVSIFPTKILLATDGSEEAQQAARASGELSKTTGSEVHIAYVLHSLLAEIGGTTSTPRGRPARSSIGLRGRPARSSRMRPSGSGPQGGRWRRRTSGRGSRTRRS